MEIVSFETAKKLKNNGFPQPEPNFGQFWYNEEGTVFIVIETFTHPLAHYAWINQRGRDHVVIENAIFNKMYFAPTATDILRELWFLFDLTFNGRGNWVVCARKNFNYGPTVLLEHGNPAEACAIVWMQEIKI